MKILVRRRRVWKVCYNCDGEGTFSGILSSAVLTAAKLPFRRTRFVPRACGKCEGRGYYYPLYEFEPGEIPCEPGDKHKFSFPRVFVPEVIVRDLRAPPRACLIQLTSDTTASDVLNLLDRVLVSYQLNFPWELLPSGEHPRQYAGRLARWFVEYDAKVASP